MNRQSGEAVTDRATGPLLTAATPREWLVRHAERRSGPVDGDDPESTPVTAEELLGDGARSLRAVHAGLCEDGVPPAAAAKWVVSWFAGSGAGTVGIMLAFAAAAPVADLDRMRWRVDADGWPEYADPGEVPVLVDAAHPWAGLPESRTVAGERAVVAGAIPALVAAVEPIVEAGRGLARVGRTALWAEVADELGLPVLHDVDLPVDDAAVRRLRLAVHAPGVPWRKRPDLRIDPTGHPPAYLGRKGGCCLNYRCPPDPEPDPDGLDERERAYRERFPPLDEPRYCSTCSLRDRDDCEDRQRFWLHQERAARQPPPDPPSVTSSAVR